VKIIIVNNKCFDFIIQKLYNRYMKLLNVLATIEYQYLLVGVLAAILYVIWTTGIKPVIQKNKIMKNLDVVAEKNNYTAIRARKAKYDFVLESRGESKHKRVFIKAVFVPRISTITINSKDTWNLHYGGSNKPGKGYPYNRYLNELKHFLNYEVADNELKLILIYKGTLKIQKYLNESEIEIVNFKDIVYDYKIINYEDYSTHFQDL